MPSFIGQNLRDRLLLKTQRCAELGWFDWSLFFLNWRHRGISIPLHQMHDCKLLVCDWLLLDNVETSTITTIFHLVLSILVLWHVQGWMCLLELRAWDIDLWYVQLLRVEISMLIQFIDCHSVAICQGCLLSYRWVQDVVFEVLQRVNFGAGFLLEDTRFLLRFPWPLDDVLFLIGRFSGVVWKLKRAFRPLTWHFLDFFFWCFSDHLFRGFSCQVFRAQLFVWLPFILTCDFFFNRKIGWMSVQIKRL